MSSFSPKSAGQTEKNDTPMSGAPENGPNGFTAVNGPPASPTAVGARNIDPVLPGAGPQKDWQPAHPDPSAGHGPYHVPPPKRRFAELDSEDDPKRLGPGPAPTTSSEHVSGPGRPVDMADGDRKFGQAQAAAPREAGWNGAVDENRMAELLRQDSESRIENGVNGSPNGSHMQENGSPITPDHQAGDGDLIMTSAGVHVDMKKRKRAFTNRTKTGCQTCRRRKKKCDEAKPACNNCIRGGFTCLGYAKNRDVLKQPASSNRALNLAAAPVRDREYAAWGESRSAPRGITTYDPSSLPAGLQDGRQSHSLDSRPMWSSPAYNGSTPRSMAPETRSLPPLQYQHSRDIPAPSKFSPMHAARAGMNQLEGEPRSYALTPPTNGFDHSRDQSQDKQFFKPEDQQYASRREACRTACGHFNRAAFDGSSAEEIRRRLKAILKPEGPNQGANSLSQTYQFPEAITVDAPFFAEYGNNLNVGKNVRIGSNCNFKDPRPILIGDGARIGSGVMITGESDAIPPKEYGDYKVGASIRIGSCVAIGARCTIAANQFEITIGDNAIIGPGCLIACHNRKINIGKDCNIGPGCVVTMDVPDGTHLPPPMSPVGHTRL